MTDYLELITQGSGLLTLGILGSAVIFVIIMLAIIRTTKKKERLPDIPRGGTLQDKARSVKQEILSAVEEVSGIKHGAFKAMVIRPGQILDFTTIDNEIGEQYQAGTSLPSSGGHFIVQLKDGKIVDYDPRDIPVREGEQPEDAFIAIDWSSANRFWTAPLQWWKTPANWFVAIMLAIVFICTLAVVG